MSLEQKKETVYGLASEARANGNFSRRHRTRAAHDAARATPSARNPVSKLVRKLGADLRQVERAKRTDAQQLAHLDSLFGIGLGAERERAKLEARIEAASVAPVKVIDKKTGEQNNPAKSAKDQRRQDNLKKADKPAKAKSA